MTFSPCWCWVQSCVGEGTTSNLVTFAAKAGFEPHPAGPDSQTFLQSAEGQALLAAGNAKELMAGFAKIAHVHLEQTHREILQLAEGADLVVAGVLAVEHAASVAEAKRVPLVPVHFAPLGRTRAYAAFPVTTRRLGGTLNLLTWTLFERVAWKAFASDINRVRAWLGLPAVSARFAHREEGKKSLGRAAGQTRGRRAHRVCEVGWSDARARALRQLLEPATAERARVLADAMRGESNAVARAADLIEARIKGSTARPLAARAGE